MKKRYDALGSADIADIRRAINERLKGLHPELVFKAKDIRWDHDQLFVDLRVRVTDSVADVARSRGLTLEKVGEYTLVGFEPTRNPKKPYVLRKNTGEEYEAGISFVEKMFRQRIGDGGGVDHTGTEETDRGAGKANRKDPG